MSAASFPGAAPGPVRLLVGIHDPDLEVRVVEAAMAAGCEVARALEAGEAVAAALDGRADAAIVSSGLYGLDAGALGELARAGVPLTLLVRAGEEARFAAYGHVLPEELAPAAIVELALQVAAERPAPVDVPPEADDEDAAGGDGLVVAVLGTGGGAGATAAAIGLTDALARRGLSALLVAADPRGPSVAAYLDLDPRRHVVEALARAGDGVLPGKDGAALGDELAAQLQAVGSLQVLLGPERPEAWRAVDGHGARVLAWCRRRFAVTVVDAGRVPPEHELQTAALAAAGRVLLVALAEIPGLDGAGRALGYVAGHREAGRVGVVLRRARDGRQYGPAEVAEALGVPVVAVVPEDAGRFRAAQARQVPVTRLGGKAAAALAALAQEVAGEDGVRPGGGAAAGRGLLALVRR